MLLLQLLQSVVGLGVLVCYIIMLIKMFQRGATVPAVFSIVLLCCGGIGIFIPLIYGWMKASEWNINKNLLYAYTGLLVLDLILIAVVLPGQLASMQNMQQPMPTFPSR